MEQPSETEAVEPVTEDVPVTSNEADLVKPEEELAADVLDKDSSPSKASVDEVAKDATAVDATNDEDDNDNDQTRQEPDQPNEDDDAGDTTTTPEPEKTLSVDSPKNSNRRIFGIFAYKKGDAKESSSQDDKDGDKNEKDKSSDRTGELEAAQESKEQSDDDNDKHDKTIEKAENSKVKPNFWSNFVGNKLSKTPSEDNDNPPDGSADKSNDTTCADTESGGEDADLDDADAAKSYDDENARKHEKKESPPRSPGRLRFWSSRKGTKSDDSETNEKDDAKGDTTDEEVNEIKDKQEDEEVATDEEEDDVAYHSLNEWILSVKERHGEMIEFEKERNKSFLTQWTALQAYVQVYDEIAMESLAEMQRLGDFVGGIQTAQKRFTEIMKEKKRQILIAKGGMRSQPAGENTSDTPNKSSYDTQDMPWTDIVGVKKQQSMEDGEESSSGHSRHEAPALDDLADHWAMATDEPPPPAKTDTLPTIPSRFTPLLDALEVSHEVWESKIASNSQETASGILNELKSSWPPKIRSQRVELDRLCEEVFPVVVTKMGAIKEAWEIYESTVEGVIQAAAAHRKSQNSIRHMFSRAARTPADEQMALSRSLSDKADVWIAEQKYCAAVRDLKMFWDQRIIGYETEVPTSIGVEEKCTQHESDGQVVVPISETNSEDEDRSTVPHVLSIREALERMGMTEAQRRAHIAENLKHWVAGQERLLVGSETATGLAWMEAKKSAGLSTDEDSEGKQTELDDENGDAPADQQKDDESSPPESNLLQVSAEDSESELQLRRAQIEAEVQKTLSEKWTADLARDWVQGSSRPEDTLHLMEEVFGVDTYLESPHVVSAAVGEWWLVEQPKTGTSEEEEPQRHVALIIISSGPQMHIYNLKTAVVVLDLETPPQDALMDIMSGNRFPAPNLSIPLADAQVQTTDEVDVLEVKPTAPTAQVPCIRLLCPHLNNIY